MSELEQRVCPECGAEYQPYRKDQTRCSDCLWVLKAGHKPGDCSGTRYVQWCNPCKAAYARFMKWIKNPSRKPYASQGKPEPTWHGMSVEEFRTRSWQQNGCCEFCGKYQEFLTIDHDHETGKVRFLLCKNCNMGLGQFRDNPDALLAAAAGLLRMQNQAFSS